MTGGSLYTKPIAEAVYCADPDAVAACIKLCAAPDVVSIGVRVGSYLQAVAYFALVLFAPDEGGAESMWLGLSVSFSFLAAGYLQMYLGTITLHHIICVMLLSHLPYVSTLAGMNSLTSYEVLGPAGVLMLQAGMLLKSVFTALLWAMCLYAFFVGQLPSWLHLNFRQANCFDSTAIVVWLTPVKRTDENRGLSLFLIISYSIVWFVVLCAGSYWTLIAPRVLVKRGGHLRDPHKKKIKGAFFLILHSVPLPHRSSPELTDRDDHTGFPTLRQKLHLEPLQTFVSDSSTETEPDDTPAQREEKRERRREREREGEEYGYRPRREEDDDLDLMTMRSLSKSAPTSYPPAASVPLPSSRPSSRASTLLPPYDPAPAPAPSASTSSSSLAGVQVPRSVSPPPATEGMTAVAPWSKGLRGTDKEAAERWTKRQIESRHHFIIWPLVAVLLLFTILTIELQIALNDIYEGEMHLDFPGALTLFLALPTAWAVVKALKRIQEGRRPTPEEREDRTFFEPPRTKPTPPEPLGEAEAR
ncbi:hypothetical protein JCM8097_005126 [Rhodosporidiobolus ruineniae]